jgi:hypothetical protein
MQRSDCAELANPELAALDSRLRSGAERAAMTSARSASLRLLDSLVSNETPPQMLDVGPEDGDAPFTFSSDEPVLIRVKSLYNLVRDAWEKLDKVKLNSNWEVSTNPEIKNPIFLPSATATMPVTASGSIYLPPRRANSRTKKS